METISSREEYIATAEAFAKVELPWCGTMSFDTAGRTMMGVTSQNIVDLMQTLEPLQRIKSAHMHILQMTKHALFAMGRMTV